MGTEGVMAILDKIKRTTTHRVKGIKSLGLKSNSSDTALPKVTTTQNKTKVTCADLLKFDCD